MKTIPNTAYHSTKYRHAFNISHHCTDWPSGFPYQSLQNWPSGVPPPIDAQTYFVILMYMHMTIVCIISHIGIAPHHCTDWPSGFSYQSLQIGRQGSPTNWCTVMQCLLSIHNDHFMYRKPDFSPKYTSQGSDYRPIHINLYLYYVLYNIVCGCGNKRSIIIITWHNTAYDTFCWLSSAR